MNPINRNNFFPERNYSKKDSSIKKPILSESSDSKISNLNVSFASSLTSPTSLEGRVSSLDSAIFSPSSPSEASDLVEYHARLDSTTPPSRSISNFTDLILPKGQDEQLFKSRISLGIKTVEGDTKETDSLIPSQLLADLSRQGYVVNNVNLFPESQQNNEVILDSKGKGNVLYLSVLGLCKGDFKKANAIALLLTQASVAPLTEDLHKFATSFDLGRSVKQATPVAGEKNTVFDISKNESGEVIIRVTQKFQVVDSSDEGNGEECARYEGLMTINVDQNTADLSYMRTDSPDKSTGSQEGRSPTFDAAEKMEKSNLLSRIFNFFS